MLVTKNIIFETSTIADGNMSFRFREDEEVISNREQFLKKLNIPVNRYICMQCNHGSVISNVNITNYTAYTDSENQPLEAEVLVTKEKGLALMLLTADCLPTAFYDPVTKTIALAHFSRETIANGLPQKTIGFLRRSYNVEPTNLEVFTGPHIHKESYAFDPPLKLVKELIAPFTEIKNNKALIDLHSAHNHQLTGLGVKPENIKMSEIDTYTSPDHFSHFESVRNNTKPHGRIATVLMLKS